jgi:cytochrome c553
MNRPAPRLAAAATLLAVLVPGQSYAQPQAPMEAPPEVAACKACHGPEGVSINPAIPNLAGQKPAYLEAQLTAFRSKDRKNDLMNAIAGQLSDSDIHQFAAYWASRPAAPAADAQGQPPPSAAIHSRMTFPANFPTGFTAYQDVVEEGVLTRSYVNAVAWKAARAGQSLPDGSIILRANYKAEKDATGKDVAGAVQSYNGMESRKGWGKDIPALLRNENWDYALFAADGQRKDQLNQAQCLACHKPAAADSYVFTIKQLRTAAAK